MKCRHPTLSVINHNNCSKGKVHDVQMQLPDALPDQLA
jgi:hypothetical protein